MVSRPQKQHESLFSPDEEKVLTELQKNSRKSIKTIAEQCGFSRQKVEKIIKNLEENKVIWGYTVVTDEKKQGFLRYILLIKRSAERIDRDTAKKIAHLHFDEGYKKRGIFVETGHYLHGEYDWMIMFTARTLRDAKKFSTHFLENYPNRVTNVTLMQVLHTTKNHHIKNPTPDDLLDLL